MAFDPTKMQRKAIETKGNVLVSAAAGSGKTAVLTERVVSMLKDPYNPTSADRLLIVTFTNAAAAEMRARIEKKLYEEIQKAPDNVALIKQKYLLSSADISTIDSFCIRMLRENFEKCDIEPDFKIIEATKEKLITQKILREIFTEAIQNKPDALKILLELTGCENNDENLCDKVSDIQLYINQLPFPKDYLNGFLTPYEAPFERGNVWFDFAFESCAETFKKISDSIAPLTEAAEMAVAKDDKYINNVKELKAQLDTFADYLNSYDWNGFYAAVNNFYSKTVRVSADDPNGQIFKRIKKDIISNIRSMGDIFYDTKENVQKNIDKARPGIELLVEMITELDSRLFESFRAENAYTFYNIEQMAFNLLCKKQGDEVVFTEYATELADRYDEVLVDEFQDVNDLQDMLFYALSNREEKLFVVGDVKQSIYGFRGSNPENFLNKRNRYIDVEKASAVDSKKIILSDNFRSRKGVCDAVNYFFSLFLAGQISGLVYNEEEYLNASGKFPPSDGECCELLIVDRANQINKETAIETESKKIAEYILSLMNGGDVVTDGDTMRKARFDDFAILLDKASGTAPIMTQILNSYGIPVSFDGGSFLESYEVSTVMSLLQVIDNPKCDVELLEIMMSPLFGFTADDLACIRAKDKKCSLYASLIDYAKSGDQKSELCLKKLAEFRKMAAILPIDRLVSSILHSTDIFNQMSALPDGKTRRNNLQALIGYAKGYYDSFGGGVYGFLKYMRSLSDRDFKVSSPKQGVKIMTMHGSKGLQFPICIIAALSSRMNKSEITSSMIHQKKYGIGFRYYDEELKDTVETVGHIAMKSYANAKLVSEKLRLLYVAMTRAIDRLCLVIASDDFKKHISGIADEISDEPHYITREFLESKSNMGDWVLAAMLLHPCGEQLRKFAENKPCKLDNEAQIGLNVICTESTLAPEVETAKDACVNDEFVNQIKENLSYSYPYEALRFIQAKASVSSLVHGAENDRFAFSERPAFMTGDRLSGAARGTAVHHIMQFIHFSEHVDVKAEIERLTEWKFITEQEAASADLAAIEAFFNSDIYKRIMKSDGVHREMRFLTEIPAGRFDNKLQDIEGADIIVQGAVDLCFEEDDSIVVLDFKTDREDNPEKLKDFYAEQLNIYAAAVEKIFKKPVKEKVIYSLYLGKEISF